MPKKSAATRGSGQRHKPKAQKSFELVRQVSESREKEAESSVEQVAEIKPLPRKSVAPTATAEIPPSNGMATSATTSTTSQGGSASARLAARRQGAQKTQQRAPATIISAENYGYVRKDLIFIAVLAIIMFSTIIILHFIPAIGG